MTLDACESVYRAQEALFRRGQAERSLRGFDTRVMAVTYQGAIDMMIAYLTAHPEIDRHAYADALAAARAPRGARCARCALFSPGAGGGCHGRTVDPVRVGA